MIRRLAMLCAFAAVAQLSMSAQAERRGPVPTVEAASQRLQVLLRESRENDGLRPLIDELFDLDRMARDALGDHWGETTEAQRRTYRSLLRRLVWQAAFQQAHAGLDYTLRVGATSVDLRRSRIETIVAVEGSDGGTTSTVFLTFYLERDARGWRVIEVEIDGVRLVRSYRLQFHRIIIGSGFDGLLRRMRERLGPVESGAPRSP